jgi:hypothetical protein
VVNGRVAAQQVLSRHKWHKEDILFDVAPRPPFRVHQKSMDPPAPTGDLAPRTYEGTIAAEDISPLGELTADASVRLLRETASRYMDDNKRHLAVMWPEMNANAPWHTTFFQMRFVFVPFARVQAGDKVVVETTFTPTASGKGQFTQDLLMQSSRKKLANAGGRVLIRPISP